MKTLLAIAILAAFAFTARAQTVTNIASRVTIETVTAGVTNSTQSTVRLDYGTKKEALLIDGIVKAHNDYKAAGGTATLEAWLKTDFKDRANEYAKAKQAVDNALLVTKLSTLLLSNPDLLSNSDLSNLNTIAAKAP